jgi:hypothetical protein
MGRLSIFSQSALQLRRLAARVTAIAQRRPTTQDDEGLCWTDQMERAMNDELLGKGQSLQRLAVGARPDRQPAKTGRQTRD